MNALRVARPGILIFLAWHKLRRRRQAMRLLGLAEQVVYDAYVRHDREHAERYEFECCPDGQCRNANRWDGLLFQALHGDLDDGTD